MTIFPLHVQILTPKRLGVKSTTPTPLNISATMQTCKIFWPRCSVIYTFQSSAYFAAILAKIGHAVPTLFNFLSMLVRQKNGSKMWFCVQSQCIFRKIWLCFVVSFVGKKWISLKCGDLCFRMSWKYTFPLCLLPIAIIHNYDCPLLPQSTAYLI